ncbi:MAG: DedA family protein [bacterium]
METILQHIGDYHYQGLFVILLLCGAGLPLPEDLVIITGGYLAYLGETRFLPTLIVLYAGAMIGDFLLYGIGRRYGSDIIAHRRLTWLFTPKRVKAINHYFHQYGSRTLFFARFLVGLRAPIFLSAGAFKIPFSKMALFDGAAALLSIPLLTYLAYHFGGELDQLIVWVKRVEHGIWVIAALFFLFIGFKVISRLRQKAPEPKEEDFEIPVEKEEN